MASRSVHARIERAFGRWGRLMVRRRLIVLALSSLVTVALASGLPQMTADFSNDSYLLPGDTARQVYDDFRARYGSDERIVVGIEPTAVFDLGFVEKLRVFHDDVEREVPHVNEVLSLVNARLTRGEDDALIVEELMEDWRGDAASLALLRERVQSNPLYVNTFVSRDHSFTALIVEPNAWSSRSGLDLEEALAFEGEEVSGIGEPETLRSEEMDELIRVLRDVMARHEAPGFRLHLVGAEVMGSHLKAISTADMGLYSGLSVLCIAALLFSFFRRVTAAVLPLVVVMLSALATFGVMAWLGLPFTLVTQILPSFLIAVGVCDSVHILSLVYRRLAAGEDRGTAVAHAVEHSGMAVVLTSLTTAAGLASFVAADLAPVAQLGIISPVGVLLALLYSLTLLPALLAIVPLEPPARRSDRGVVAAVDATLVRLGDMATAHPRAILVGTALLLIAAAPGVGQLRFSNASLEWLFEDDPVRVAIEKIDEEFEGLTSVEILIDSGREDGLHEPDLLRRIESVVAEVESRRDGPVRVGRSVSIVDVVKETNRALHADRPEHYIVPDDRRLVAQELLLFENSGSDDLEDVTDSQFREGRVTLRVNLVDGMYYVAFLEDLESRLVRALGDDVSFEITGGTALSSRAFSVLLTSLARSYGLALLIITPLMVFLIGDLRRGVLAMIPNLIPVFLVLALMGWIDIPLNISTLLVGSIAIGLAVDDTIHFMHRFDREYAETGDGAEAVRRTLATTGTAMLVTSLVLAASFFIFLFGHFYGMVHLGVLAGSATLLAFLADVLVAPALMVLVTAPGPRQASRGRQALPR